jgi:hypothetical protein
MLLICRRFYDAEIDNGGARGASGPVDLCQVESGEVD